MLQVTALAFPNGRPTSAPDPKAAPVTVTNSLGKKMEVIYDWGELGCGADGHLENCLVVWGAAGANACAQMGCLC